MTQEERYQKYLKDEEKAFRKSLGDELYDALDQATRKSKWEIERSIHDYAIGIRYNGKRVLTLVEGAVTNEENIEWVCKRLNYSNA